MKHEYFLCHLVCHMYVLICTACVSIMRNACKSLWYILYAYSCIQQPGSHLSPRARRVCMHLDRDFAALCLCVHAGTTTATVLTRAILNEGCKAVAAGMNPMDLRRGINIAVDHVVGVLKGRSKMISTTEEIAQVQCETTCAPCASAMCLPLVRGV